MPAQCGAPCTAELDGMGPKICDGKGHCVSPEMNPCAVHGCEGKVCGDSCLMGDILGWCEATGECSFDQEPRCGKSEPKGREYFKIFLKIKFGIILCQKIYYSIYNMNMF